MKNCIQQEIQILDDIYFAYVLGGKMDWWKTFVISCSTLVIVSTITLLMASGVKRIKIANAILEQKGGPAVLINSASSGEMSPRDKTSPATSPSPTILPPPKSPIPQSIYIQKGGYMLCSVSSTNTEYNPWPLVPALNGLWNFVHLGQVGVVHV